MYSQQSRFQDYSSNLSLSQPNNETRLLSPFQQKLLQEKLKTNIRPEYRRRIEIMLMADRGCSQTQICSALNCSHETARYWTYIAVSGDAHKWKDLPIGRPKTVNEEYLNRLRDLVTKCPREYGYAFERWTAGWLSKHLAKELGIEVSERHVNRLLKKMGLSTRKSRSEIEDNSSQNGESNRYKSGNTSNIVIRNLQGDKQPQTNSLSPFHLI